LVDLPPVSFDSEEEQELSDEEEEQKSAKEKEARVKTNKRKVGTHFYETANVKNRNRKRSKTTSDPKRLEKKLKGDGKRRNK
jgi:nuclear GTP-binding protein